MPPVDVMDVLKKDIFFIAPEIVLMVWGLLVVLVDVGLARKLTPDARRYRIGMLSLLGVGLALVAAAIVCLVPLFIRGNPNPDVERTWISPQFAAYLLDPDPTIFYGTIAGDVQSSFFNLLYVALLGLVVGLSMSASFTEEWGEYFALLFWATVGMMLLTASEELVTLFLTLETMTICLYLSTALEKTRQRSAEAGLKYFVYGSVSSALFLFGLSLIYGMTGTTHLDAIQKLLRTPGTTGLAGNMAGAIAILLLMVGFGFKIAAVPFHQWAPDAYEGAPAPVAAWIATGSKLASFIALMKVFLHALLPWSNPSTSVVGPGWIGIVAVIAAVTMTYGNFAALAQRNLKRMLAYSSIAHAGYILVGVAAVSVSYHESSAAAAVLYYLIVYAFANVGAFAAAAWLIRDKNSDNIEDLNGLGFQEPLLAVCILVLMLSLIGIPPLAGFFGKLYVFMEALNQPATDQPISLMWLVALGLFNSVVSAFYYVRVLKAMFLRPPGEKRLAPASRAIAVPIVLGTIVVVIFGIMPDSLMSVMQAAAVPMLTKPIDVPVDSVYSKPSASPRKKVAAPAPTPEQLERMKQMAKGTGGGPPATPKKGANTKKGGGFPGKKGAGKAKTGGGAPGGKNAPAKGKTGQGASREAPGKARPEAIAMKGNVRP
jgi:NADH-quinone oxidoreductase subunit N